MRLTDSSRRVAGWHHVARWCALALSALACGCSLDEGANASPSPSNQTQPAPVVVQVENIATARPQSGLSGADVVYEYLTEGGITRFSVIYLHPPQGQVGPIRSARLVTIALTKLYGAVLVYSGAGNYINQQITQAGLVNFTESTAQGALFRVTDRGAPHNLYTNGGNLSQLLSRANAAPISWHLWPRTTTPSTKARNVMRFQVPISAYEAPVWTFDAASGAYTRSEPDTGAFIDADTGRPLAAATVIVQQVNVSPAPQVEDVTGAQGVEQDVQSGGAMQVFSGGHEYDGTWSQPSDGPPTLRLKDGTAAPIAPGLVWVELVATGSPATQA